MSETKPQPLEVLRTYMKGNFTLDLDKAATQTLWNECRNAEDKIAALESRLAEAAEIIKNCERDGDGYCPDCVGLLGEHFDTCRIGRFLKGVGK